MNVLNGDWSASKFILLTGMQCCGTVLIFCGSSSGYGRVSVPVPDPDNISAVFGSRVMTKNCKILLLRKKILHFFTKSATVN